jgi:transposase, IS5 family
VIEMRRAQLSFGDGLIRGEVKDLREQWMNHVDKVLEDEDIIATVFDALSKRHPKSRSRGRLGAPAEMVLRLLILKHIRNWSYVVLEREVRANLVYRDFTRVGGAKTPDANHRPMGSGARSRDHQTNSRPNCAIAQGNGVTQGRRMRVDTTVVETNVHYPTDSSLLGDAVRVLTRTMKKITKIVGDSGAKLRDRSRSVKLRMLEIARAARAKGPQSTERLKQAYSQLLNSSSRVLGQTKRFSQEISEGVKRSDDILKQIALEALRKELDEMAPRLRQVSVGANRRSAGSARAKNGAQDTRDASALLSADTDSTAANIKPRPE